MCRTEKAWGQALTKASTMAPPDLLSTTVCGNQDAARIGFDRLNVLRAEAASPEKYGWIAHERLRCGLVKVGHHTLDDGRR